MIAPKLGQFMRSSTWSVTQNTPKRRGSVNSLLNKHNVDGHNGNDYEVKCTSLVIEVRLTKKGIKNVQDFYRKPRNEHSKRDLPLRVSLCRLYLAVNSND